MKILGIDYGKRKIGLAISEASLAEPYKVVRYQSSEWLLGSIKQAIKEEKIEKIVIGLSEGEIAQLAKKLGESLKEITGLPIDYQDETLTSRDAQMLSIQAGIKRKKRKGMEDAFAASLMLQSYLDA